MSKSISSTLIEAGWNGPKGLLDGFNGQPQLPFPSYRIPVGYSKKTVNCLVREGGYDYVNGNVSDAHFPVTENEEEQNEIFLVPITHHMSDAEVTQLLDEWNLKDTNIKEELSLGIAHHDLQRHGPIVARGSMWRRSGGRLLVPCLDSRGLDRDLRLVDLDGDWDSGWQFAAVRK
jgi:hypothetical protein